jgi:SWIM zinc finger
VKSAKSRRHRSRARSTPDFPANVIPAMCRALNGEVCTYRVDYEDETCSCPAFRFGGGEPCKHVLAIGVHYAKTRRRISVAGDPFAFAGEQARQCACYSGWVFVGFEDEHGEQRAASYRCGRCAENSETEEEVRPYRGF